MSLETPHPKSIVRTLILLILTGVTIGGAITCVDDCLYGETRDELKRKLNLN